MDALAIEVDGISVGPRTLGAMREIFEREGITYGTIVIGALKGEDPDVSVMWHSDGVRPIGCSAQRFSFQKRSTAVEVARRFAAKWKRFYG